jgi:two-component system response regulator QseB
LGAQPGRVVATSHSADVGRLVLGDELGRVQFVRSDVGHTARVSEVPSATVLVVEDDAELGRMLVRLLTGAGYAATLAPDGQRGLHLGLTREWDAMVIDRGLPAVEGLDLLRALRRKGIRTPVLVLSALGAPAERVAGLDAGAEDYVGKPFDVDELLARVRALLRRHFDSTPTLPLGRGRLDVASRVVIDAAGREIPLSEREASLLATLAARPEQVFTRRDLLSRVFDDADSDNAVDTYVHYCRRKLGAGVIRTVRGLGYRCGEL